LTGDAAGMLGLRPVGTANEKIAPPMADRVVLARIRHREDSAKEAAAASV
jgi:hypothetical protein